MNSQGSGNLRDLSPFEGSGNLQPSGNLQEKEKEMTDDEIVGYSMAVISNVVIVYDVLLNRSNILGSVRHLFGDNKEFSSIKAIDNEAMDSLTDAYNTVNLFLLVGKNSPSRDRGKGQLILFTKLFESILHRLHRSNIELSRIVDP